MEVEDFHGLQSDILPLKLSSENDASSSHVPVLRKEWDSQHFSSFRLSPKRTNQPPLVVSMLDSFCDF